MLSQKDLRYKRTTVTHFTLTTSFYTLKLSYNVPKSQVQLLRAGSRRASQSFKYECHDSIASLVFRGSNGNEISATQTLHNGCQVRENYFATASSSLHMQSRHSAPDVSILEVSTKKVEQLPLKDFAATGNGEGAFGFEMGPACFY